MKNNNKKIFMNMPNQKLKIKDFKIYLIQNILIKYYKKVQNVLLNLLILNLF